MAFSVMYFLMRSSSMTQQLSVDPGSSAERALRHGGVLSRGVYVRERAFGSPTLQERRGGDFRGIDLA